jgi:type IV secretory pathway VirB6-like protein
MNWVVGSANDLMNFLSGLFLQAAGLSSPATTTWSLVDAYDAQVEAVVVVLAKDVVQIAPPFVNFPNLFAIVLISLGGCFFEVCMLAVTCFAKVILTLALSIGPIFILTLLFTPTSGFFDAWLSKLLSAILLSAITFFLAGLSLSITGSFLTSFLAEVSTINFIVAGMVVAVIEFLLGIVMIQAPILAASLSRGAAFHSGLRTVSALLAGRASRAGRSSVVPSAAASAAGPTAGSYGPRTWGRGAQAAASAVRRAAYKLASIRGRS